MYEISLLELVKNGFLIHTMNYGIGSVFCKGPQSDFSEGSSPGSAPLYEVCRGNVLIFLIFTLLCAEVFVASDKYGRSFMIMRSNSSKAFNNSFYATHYVF